jgi:arsenate-mycothiol transferase
MSGGAPSSVLFVCVHNSGKSQIAAGAARRLAPHVRVESAGTDPSEQLHAGSVETLAEVGIDIGDQRPRPITPGLVEAADLVVVLGTEAQVTTHDGTPVRTWAIDEPSLRGIEGAERMRLMREEITERVRDLLTDTQESPGP